MTLERARQILTAGGDLPALADAIRATIESPRSSVGDLLLGLQHSPFIAEQAALELYVRTGRPYPADRSRISTDPDDWHRWLAEQANARSCAGS